MTEAPWTSTVAVLGAGNWGTTLAQRMAMNGHRVLLWTRDDSLRDAINERRFNDRFLPGIELHPLVRAVSDPGAALATAGLVFVAIPSQAFRAVCREARSIFRPEHLVVHGTKGLEVASHRRMSEILIEETCVRQLGVLAGPNIAAEVARGLPCGTVVASPFPRVVERARRALESREMRVFAGTDVLGVELCGALKNVVAIAAGIADEMHIGENAKAFLLTRGMAELTRLAFTMGAEAATTTGLAGMGDLMVTCASPLSRNHRVGVALARGEKLEDIVAQLGMVAEGVYASIAARALAVRHGVEMPLFDRVDRVLHDGLSPADALSELMTLTVGRDVARFARRARGALVR